MNDYGELYEKVTALTLAARRSSAAIADMDAAISELRQSMGLLTARWPALALMHDGTGPLVIRTLTAAELLS